MIIGEKTIETKSVSKKLKNTLSLSDRMLVVARIREMKGRGMPTTAIKDALYAEGFRFSNGNAISVETITTWQREYLKQGTVPLAEKKPELPQAFLDVLTSKWTDESKVQVMKAMAGVR